MLQRDGIEKKLTEKRLNLTATSNAKAHTLLRNLFLWKELDGGDVGVSIMKKDYKIAIAGTGARDIIGSTKKNHDK